MPPYPDLAAAFGNGLRVGAVPPGVTARRPEEAARRFAVHRNNVAHSLIEALAGRFPVVERLVGEAFFGAMARVFVEAHPPASPVLLAWGGDFAGFLEGFPPLAGLPYLPDVARLEFARGEAFHAADREPVGPRALALAAQDPATARLALHPSVRVVPSRFAIVSIWAANQAGRAPASVDAGRPETALVLRDRAFGIPVRAVGPGDAALLAALAGARTLLAASRKAILTEPGYDPAPLLAALAQAGALAAPCSEGEP